MTLILVDTNTKKISRVDVGPKPTLQVIYSLIGCDCIAAYPLYGYPSHSFYCDDEALFKKPLPPAMLLDGYKDPVYGRILIFKHLGDGNEASPTISVEEAFEMIFFLP